MINLKIQSSGHLYFTLKDSEAQISAVMFRGDCATLPRPSKDGDHVIVLGEVSVYAPRGNYQLIVRQMRYVGLGELLVRLEQLKQQLRLRGWFDPVYKKKLPKFPHTIGVVTSPTGAVIQDILNILKRRFSGFHLILNPVKVQGDGAAQEIALAIQQFNQFQLVDVMIVGRGGGSLEDLWAFNEEIVAEAIFNSEIPVISAVGHETDNSIADLVADVRAPTPSAAAEIIIPEKEQVVQNLQQIKRRAQQLLLMLVQQHRHRLLGLLRHPILSSPYTLLAKPLQQLDDIRDDLIQVWAQILAQKRAILEARKQQLLALKPTSQLIQFRKRCQQIEAAMNTAIFQKFRREQQQLIKLDLLLNSLWQKLQTHRYHIFQLPIYYRRLDHAITQNLEQKKSKYNYLVDSLKGVDPKNLLKKGYGIIFAKKDGSVIFSINQLKHADSLIIKFADGEALVTVNQIENKSV
jgi:exodeoxyribonuclease VII large subunit